MITAEANVVESLLKYDAIQKECKKLESCGQRGGVLYTLFKSPSRLISPRDMVWAYDYCVTEKGGNVILIPATSVFLDSCPRKSGKIRAELKFGGWVLEVKSPDRTMATYIVDLDVKGSIPDWIANQSSEDQGRTPLNLTNFMKDKYGAYKRGDWGLLLGIEDDMDDSVEESSEESLQPVSDQTVTEAQSSTPKVLLGEGKLNTHEQATIITRLNLTIADLEKFTDESTKKLWTRTSSKDHGVKVYRRKDGKSGYMGKSIVKFEAERLFKALKDPLFRKDFDPMLISMQVVEQVGDLYVVHMQHQTKNCMAKIRRDLLVAWGSRQLGSKYVVAATSITHPACPVDPRMRRINMEVCGFVIEEYWKQPSYSLVCFVVANVDYGQLPKKIVRYVNKRQVMGIHDLALAMKRREENAT